MSYRFSFYFFLYISSDTNIKSNYLQEELKGRFDVLFVVLGMRFPLGHIQARV